MSSFLFWHRTNYSALSVAGASSAGAAAAASSACLAASAAANSAFFLATISAFDDALLWRSQEPYAARSFPVGKYL